MKKTGLLLLLLAGLAFAQSTPPVTSTMAATPNDKGIVDSTPSVPFVRFQTPTQADIYCAGFISKDTLPDAKYVNGGLQTPTSTKFEIGELVYLAGKGYQAGHCTASCAKCVTSTSTRSIEGMRKLLGSVGHPYGEIGRVRVLDIRSHSAVAQVEFSCDPINPGDVAMPFVEKPPVAFHVPGHFDRYRTRQRQADADGSCWGRILTAILGSGIKLYLNMGSNQGVKVGDYFRVVRSYTADLCTIRWTRFRSRHRPRKTRRCTRRPLRRTA